VFIRAGGKVAEPDARDRQGFAAFMERYQAGFPIERAAADYLK
jgi:hypothetical protein